MAFRRVTAVATIVGLKSAQALITPSKSYRAAAASHRCSVDVRGRRATTDAKSPKYAAAATAAFTEELKNIDSLQASMMEEQCIVVDRNDKPLRPASKVKAHLCSEDLLLHRAFSVFLFNKDNKLLLQQRSKAKHTFPLYWTNTCCSHPLWVTAEMELQGGAISAVEGTKVAAIRKLEQELGITDLKAEDLKFLTKLHYQAPDKNRVWGEHEIDYLYMAQADVDIKANPNEIEQLRWVNQDELKEIVQKADAGDGDVTPWSKHIIDTWLYTWWDTLTEKGSTDAVVEAHADQEIHRVGFCKNEEVGAAV